MEQCNQREKTFKVGQSKGDNQRKQSEDRPWRQSMRTQEIKLTKLAHFFSYSFNNYLYYDHIVCSIEL